LWVPLVGVACLVLATSAGPASADDATCSYDALTKTVTVSATPAINFAPSIFRDGAGVIRVVDADTGTTSCGGTVANTDTVVINNTSATQALTGPFYIKFREPFAPGATDEPGSSDEIEFEANFGPGGPLGVDVTFTTSDPGVPMNVSLGANQINLNADEADGVDAEVTMNGVTEVQVYPGAFDDRIIASGGTGTPEEPTALPIFACGGFGGNDQIIGGNGNDRLCGVDGDDYLDGEVLTQPSPAGADVILGGPGNDTLQGYDGPDLIDGGPGDDHVEGDDFHTPTLGAPDILLGGEGDDGLSGFAADDTFFGGPGKDNVKGGLGNDLVDAGGGKDRVEGEDGNDRMKGKRGGDRLRGGPGNDRHNGGSGFDRCNGGPGADAFTSCELKTP
jgi:Ca2+-binding RTX toxin-like protein